MYQLNYTFWLPLHQTFTNQSINININPSRNIHIKSKTKRKPYCIYLYKR